jgi:cyclic pyranopterin phosphate synthase
MGGFSHLDDQGKARMIDIGDKPVTARRAVAKGRVIMAPATLALIAEGGVKKGDVLGVARLAGIMGAKRTADLIPLCHPLALDAIDVDLAPVADAIEITATCAVSARTGVEMEALTAVAIAALTLYDMCKSVDRTMRITEIRLTAKDGGRSGRFPAQQEA